MIKKSIFYMSCIFLYISSNYILAHSESVTVKAKNGEIGHGWMFGSKNNNKVDCWIAVPLHVIDDIDGKPASFNFTDINGKSGYCENTLSITEINDYSKILNSDDLAFAHVDIGKYSNECTSRLGVSGYVYKDLIKQDPDIRLKNMTISSSTFIKAKLNKSGLSDYDGLLYIKPLDEQDIIKSGLSGSVGEIKTNYGIIPFIMVVTGDPEKKLIKAIRFDKIKLAFDAIETIYHDKFRLHRAKTTGIPYRIVNYTGVPIDSSVGPNTLYQSGGCWKIAPPGGLNTITMTVELLEENEKISEVILTRGNYCGNIDYEFYIDKKNIDSNDWDRLISCKTARDENNIDKRCFLDVKNPASLRLTIRSKEPIGLTELILR